MTKPVNRIAAVATSAVLVAGLGACSSTSAVKKSDVAKKIETTVASQTNMTVKDASCDKDLEAKVGATTNCEAKVNGTTQKFLATVTSVDGKTVNFKITKG